MKCLIMHVKWYKRDFFFVVITHGIDLYIPQMGISIYAMHTYIHTIHIVYTHCNDIGTVYHIVVYEAPWLS